MSDLQNLTPANTYKALLQLDAGYTNGISGSTGANALQVSDGAGNNTSLALSTDRVGIGTTSPSSLLHLEESVGSGDAEVLMLRNPLANAVGESVSIAFQGATQIDMAKIEARTQGANASGAPCDLVFQTASNGSAATDRMIIDNAGNVGIGTTSPSSFNGAANNLVVGSGVGSEGLTIYSANNFYGSLYFADGTTGAEQYAGWVDYNHNNNFMRIATNGSEKVLIDSSGNVTPGTDDAQDFGSSLKRWDDIYATNTTIQSSDRELKQDIEELSEAETRVAQACKGLLRKYRWKDAVAQKGDEARIHFGIIAQDLEDAFTAEGLDAGRYGMFVKNTWWTADRIIPAVEAVEAVEAVYDEEGNEVSPTVEAVEAQPEKTVTDIFENSEDAPEGATEVTQRGVRYSELLAFIISAI